MNWRLGHYNNGVSRSPRVKVCISQSDIEVTEEARQEVSITGEKGSILHVHFMYMVYVYLPTSLHYIMVSSVDSTLLTMIERRLEYI